MYLRETRRRNGDGSEVSYLALAHNERDPATGTPKAKIIHNLGRAYAVDKEALAPRALDQPLSRSGWATGTSLPSDLIRGESPAIER